MSALHYYQLEALVAIEKAEARGIRRQVLALATGPGTRGVFAELKVAHAMAEALAEAGVPAATIDAGTPLD